jgi:hypothetical protein
MRLDRTVTRRRPERALRADYHGLEQASGPTKRGLDQGSPIHLHNFRPDTDKAPCGDPKATRQICLKMSGTAQLVSSEEKENRKARQSPYMFAMADRLNCSASHAILAFSTVEDYFLVRTTFQRRNRVFLSRQIGIS